ncbi:unnamed protein product [Lactuca saligna]|uniref:Uncharacterized protein n=1 Tax=Lactuca saligna TaxID=75948 RepID=A0AA35Y1J1_LACSI|nr:unnamed protein product [Lactuca saligna]
MSNFYNYGLPRGKISMHFTNKFPAHISSSLIDLMKLLSAIALSPTPIVQTFTNRKTQIAIRQHLLRCSTYRLSPAGALSVLVAAAPPSLIATIHNRRPLLHRWLLSKNGERHIHTIEVVLSISSFQFLLCLTVIVDVYVSDSLAYTRRYKCLFVKRGHACFLLPTTTQPLFPLRTINDASPPLHTATTPIPSPDAAVGFACGAFVPCSSCIASGIISGFSLNISAPLSLFFFNTHDVPSPTPSSEPAGRILRQCRHRRSLPGPSSTTQLLGESGVNLLEIQKINLNDLLEIQKPSFFQYTLKNYNLN